MGTSRNFWDRFMAVVPVAVPSSQRRPPSRLTLASDVASLRRQWLRSGLHEIPLDGEIGVRAGLLADFHGDPADRIIVATAQGGHQLMTADRRILAWTGQLERIDARR